MAPQSQERMDPDLAFKMALAGGRRPQGMSPEEHAFAQRLAYYSSLPKNLGDHGSGGFVRGPQGQASFGRGYGVGPSQAAHVDGPAPATGYGAPIAPNPGYRPPAPSAPPSGYGAPISASGTRPRIPDLPPAPDTGYGGNFGWPDWMYGQHGNGPEDFAKKISAMAVASAARARGDAEGRVAQNRRAAGGYGPGFHLPPERPYVQGSAAPQTPYERFLQEARNIAHENDARIKAARRSMNNIGITRYGESLTPPSAAEVAMDQSPASGHNHRPVPQESLDRLAGKPRDPLPSLLAYLLGPFSYSGSDMFGAAPAGAPQTDYISSLEQRGR